MIDTHCHIDDPCYASELAELIARQQAEGVSEILVPGVNLDSMTTIPAVCGQYPDYLRPAMGLHPEEVKADYREVLAQMKDWIDRYQASGTEPPLCAIGEIGLDYHFSTEFKAEQQEAFRTQLRWAQELDLPVMLHARDATEDTLAILSEIPTTGVAHCFSGSYETALAYVRAGYYIGIGGVVTFKNCKLAENLVPADGRPAIPLDRLVLETDAPYMTPVPYRGKPNESRYMSFVAAKLAETYQVSLETIYEVTTANARHLFRLR